MKFLLEDGRVEMYLIQNNYENNVLFHHGATSREVCDKSLESLQNWSTSSVDKVIACFGTNDIINGVYEKRDVSSVIHEISDVITEPQLFCVARNMNFVYVMPGLTGSVSLLVMTEVYGKPQTFLDTSSIMTTTIAKKEKSFRSFSRKFRKISQKMCIKLVRGSFWKKIEDKFRASSSPTGMPNITPIRSEMKALQLFFIFLHGPLWKVYI